jgi:hypothetical protein
MASFEAAYDKEVSRRKLQAPRTVECISRRTMCAALASCTLVSPHALHGMLVSCNASVRPWCCVAALLLDQLSYIAPAVCASEQAALIKQPLTAHAIIEADRRIGTFSEEDE